ncbi:MAG: cation:proton antiporter [Gordonia sp. (in: high G+C Gram-positive bacteria)]|uniref:cation:proton antiporter n=1 Tax=Gordonia sp. (in: high G+C Gram-positive bacteria) TaxID=84139 RepID=UPI0039E635AC
MLSWSAALVVVPLLAVLAPLLTRSVTRWVTIPGVVFEVLLGILVGPDLLNLVRPGPVLDSLSQVGVAALFFVAGSEIEASALRSRIGRLAWVGWAISLTAGIGIGWLFSPGMGAVIIGIALSSTTLGALLPILRDNGESGTVYARVVSVVGTVGEFGPIVAISVVLSQNSPLSAILLLAVFIAVATLAIVIAATMHTSGQFAIRVAVLLVAALVALSLTLHVDLLLGAFTAGVLWRLLLNGAPDEVRRSTESKIDGLAFGLLVPIFFIATGVRFDVLALFHARHLYLLLPAVLVLLLVVRGLPAAFAVPRGTGPRGRLAVSFMAATGLPIIIVATRDGVAAGLISPTTEAVLVGGGLLSLLLFPTLASAIRSSGPDDFPPADRI